MRRGTSSSPAATAITSSIARDTRSTRSSTGRGRTWTTSRRATSDASCPASASRWPGSSDPRAQSHNPGEAGGKVLGSPTKCASELLRRSQGRPGASAQREEKGSWLLRLPVGTARPFATYACAPKYSLVEDAMIGACSHLRKKFGHARASTLARAVAWGVADEFRAPSVITLASPAPRARSAPRTHRTRRHKRAVHRD